MKRPLIHSVRQGECHLCCLDLVHRGPGFIHLRGDMEAKYAEVQGYGGAEVYVGAGARTIHKRAQRLGENWPANNWTIIRLNFPSSAQWTIEALCVRYTLELFAYTSKRGRQIWATEDATSPR